MRLLLGGVLLLAACTGGSDDSATNTTLTSSPAALDEPIEWEGVQLESTPRELLASQDDGETVVVTTDPTTGASVSAIRDGDRLCVTLNASGENSSEEWCDSKAVATPEELDAFSAVRVGKVQSISGGTALLAYGWAGPDVTIVRGPDGTEVEVQRNLPFWAYGFFAVRIPAEPATLTFITKADEEVPVLAGV